MNVMQLDLSIVVVILLVWSLYFILKKTFFDPINQILSERDTSINGVQSEAREKLSVVEKKSRLYQDSLKAARLESYRQQEALRNEALRERTQVLSKGRQHAETLVASARTGIQGELGVAKGELESEIDIIANGIVKSILR